MIVLTNQPTPASKVGCVVSQVYLITNAYDIFCEYYDFNDQLYTIVVKLRNQTAFPFI